MSETPFPESLDAGAAPRRILLTGASSGIGFQAALQLRSAGHALVLPCRDASTASATLRRLAEAAGVGPQPLAPLCDLGDLVSVERCAVELTRRGEPIDSLVLNAGLQYTGAPGPQVSAQGIELTIAVNHLAHQLLAQRLLPLQPIAAPLVPPEARPSSPYPPQPKRDGSVRPSCRHHGAPASSDSFPAALAVSAPVQWLPV
jgi:NAD(P)-dependent dehydrogenase (short-subunit alcohol dehydrogenase family)